MAHRGPELEVRPAGKPRATRLERYDDGRLAGLPHAADRPVGVSCRSRGPPTPKELHFRHARSGRMTRRRGLSQLAGKLSDARFFGRRSRQDARFSRAD